MKPENSGLIALAELRALESQRLGRIEAERTAEARARQQAQLDAERQRAEQAAALAREQELARQHAAAQQQALADEAALRIAMASAAAQAEQRARLQREAQRLEAQMLAAERAARPRWPYAVVPVLVAAVGLAGGIAWHDAGAARRLEAAQAAQEHGYEQQMAAVAAKLDALADKQQRLERERGELEARLAAAVSEAERDQLRERVAEIDRELAPAATKPSKPARPHVAKPAKPKPVESEDTAKPSTRKPIVLEDDTDPLGNLERK